MVSSSESRKYEAKAAARCPSCRSSQLVTGSASKARHSRPTSAGTSALPAARILVIGPPVPPCYLLPAGREDGRRRRKLHRKYHTNRIWLRNGRFLGRGLVPRPVLADRQRVAPERRRGLAAERPHHGPAE